MVFGFAEIFSSIFESMPSQLALGNLNVSLPTPAAGVATYINEAGEPVDFYGHRVSVPGRYDKPKPVPSPTPAAVAAARMVVTTPPIKRREILAMPQPRIAGEKLKILSGSVRSRFFQQFAVRRL